MESHTTIKLLTSAILIYKCDTITLKIPKVLWGGVEFNKMILKLI